MGHGIVPDDAGWGTFGWLIIVFLLVTIIFALSLQVIIGRIRRVGKSIDRLFVSVIAKTADASASKNSTSGMKIPNAVSEIKRRRRSHGSERIDLESAAE